MKPKLIFCDSFRRIMIPFVRISPTRVVCFYVDLMEDEKKPFFHSFKEQPQVGSLWLTIEQERKLYNENK